MNTKQAKAEAEKIVQEFKPFVESEPFYSNKGGTIQKSIKYNAIQCAIIDVKHTIEQIERMYPHTHYGSELDRCQAILTELERK